jgi:hypothetical protein
VTGSEVALVAATAAHAGFQVTVTGLVYPALARVPADRWGAAHRAHSRSITGLVAMIYGALAVAGGWAVLSGPDGWTLAACAALAATAVTTCFAARIHSRLGAGHDLGRVRSLLHVDRVRAATALLALAAAALALP